MSKLINLEIITIEDGYAVLESENGSQFEIDTEYLPTNLKEGRFLRFVISHTDYNKNDEYDNTGRELNNKIDHKGVPEIPNGRKLAW